MGIRKTQCYNFYSNLVCNITDYGKKRRTRNMKKKILAALLCVAMSVTMLAGCGSKKEEAAAPAEETEAPAEEEATEEAAEVAE